MATPFVASKAVTSHDLNRLTGAYDGTYFISGTGGAVTPNAGMVLNVSAIVGAFTMANGTRGTIAYTASTVTVSTADATNPRRDLVYYDVSDGTVGVTAGTAAASSATTGPVTPNLSANRIALAEIAVGAGVTTIGSGDITDRRIQGIGAPPEYVCPLGLQPSTADANNTQTANTAIFVPMQPVTAPTTVTAINWMHTVASGNYDVGIYAYDGTTMTRITSLGSTASPAIGANRVSSNITDTVLYPGVRYYFAWAADNATESIRTASGNNAAVSAVALTKATSFPLPATAATFAAGTASANLFLFGVVSGGLPI